MKMYRYILIASFMAMTLLFTACDDDQGVTNVHTLINEVKTTDNYLQVLLARLDVMTERATAVSEILGDNGSKVIKYNEETDILDQKLGTIEDRENNKIILESIDTITEKLNDLREYLNYQALEDNLSIADKVIVQKTDKQEKDIVSLSDTKSQLEERIDSDISVSTLGKDNSSDNPNEEITVQIKNKDGLVMTENYYTGEGVLFKTRNFIIDEGNYHIELVTLYDKVSGQLLKMQEYDKDGNLSVEQMYNSDGSMREKVIYDTTTSKAKANVIYKRDLLAFAYGKDCEDGKQCVTLADNNANRSQMYDNGKKSFDSEIYIPAELKEKFDTTVDEGMFINEPRECVSKDANGNNVYVLEQVTYINDLKMVTNENPIEYYISSFSEDCSKLRCQVRHSYKHQIYEIDPLTCCHKNDTNCTNIIQ